MTICILGRQPKLGLAELESLFGAAKVRPLGAHAALVDAPIPKSTWQRLGATIKIGTVLKTQPTVHWPAMLATLRTMLAQQAALLPEGKLTIGLSAYDFPRITPQTVQAGLLDIKKHIRQSGRPVRIMPNLGLALNSAQVIHNDLTGELGCELLIVIDGAQTYIAQTTQVQDIEAYSKRDFARPKRDAFVGMLPPKLAQTMLNLAQVKPQEHVLDPFCGTGVVLQEASLFGAQLYATDMNDLMVHYTRDNMQWLDKLYNQNSRILYEVADATTHTWQQPIDHVVSEIHLGQPLSALPNDPQKLQTIRHTCDTIARAFLTNIHPQLQAGSRCCLALPAWRLKPGLNRFLHLPVIDDLYKIGYNRISFSRANASELIYHRPDQVVARELLVVTVR